MRLTAVSAPPSSHRDTARGRAGGDGGRRVRIRHDLVICCCSVEGNVLDPGWKRQL